MQRNFASHNSNISNNNNMAEKDDLDKLLDIWASEDDLGPSVIGVTTNPEQSTSVVNGIEANNGTTETEATTTSRPLAGGNSHQSPTRANNPATTPLGTDRTIRVDAEETTTNRIDLTNAGDSTQCVGKDSSGKVQKPPAARKAVQAVDERLKSVSDELIVI